MGWLLEWGSREIWALRMVRRDSHQSLGEHLGASEQTVRRWEKGGQPPTHKELLRKLDETLAALEPWRRAWFDELRVHTPTPTVDAAANGSTGEEDEADRRQANKALAAGLSTAAFPLDAVDRIAHHGDRPVDSKLVTGHESIARALVAEYLSGDPRAVVPVALSHADDALGLLDHVAGPSDRQRVEALAVGANARVGLWAFHNGDRGCARRHLAAALGVATESEDLGLAAQAIGAASILYSALPSGGRGGDPQRAAALLEQASDLARHADAATRTWVSIWRADEAAAVEDLQVVRASLEAADRALDLAGNDLGAGSRMGPLVYGVTQQLASVRAQVSALTGRFADAERTLDAVLASAVTLHQRVVLSAQIGRIRVSAGEPESACEALITALDLIPEASYAVGIQRIRGVRARFPANWAGLPCVQELDERLRLVD